jgi:hypothetical protein
LLQSLLKCRDAGHCIRVSRAAGSRDEHANVPDPLALLRARRERPSCRRAAERG